MHISHHPGFLIRHSADLSKFPENPVFLVRPFLSSVGSKLWLSYVNFRAQLDQNYGSVTSISAQLDHHEAQEDLS